MAHREITFDNPVYSDAELTTEITATLCVTNSTQLPVVQSIDGELSSVTVHYSATPYRATCKNNLGDELYHVDFNYPADITGNEITNGVWDA